MSTAVALFRPSLNCSTAAASVRQLQHARRPRPKTGAARQPAAPVPLPCPFLPGPPGALRAHCLPARVRSVPARSHCKREICHHVPIVEPLVPAKERSVVISDTTVHYYSCYCVCTARAAPSVGPCLRPPYYCTLVPGPLHPGLAQASLDTCLQGPTSDLPRSPVLLLKRD